MTEERRQLLLSLQAREETLRNQYESHIQHLEERNRRKIEILIKQHQSVELNSVVSNFYNPIIMSSVIITLTYLIESFTISEHSIEGGSIC